MRQLLSSSCRQCEADFFHYGPQVFCSLDCFYKSRKGSWPVATGMVERVCGHCGGDYRAFPSRRLRFCSQACHWANMRDPSKAERKRTRTASERRLLRLETLAAYGGQCSCCGESDEAFLVIDHVSGGGNEHRQAIRPSDHFGRGGGGTHMYRWLRDQGYPPGFQALCANCNMAKEKPGGCPHQGVMSSASQTS